jgi:hypothetical protein
MKLPCTLPVAAPSPSETRTRSELTDVRPEERRPRQAKPGSPFEVTRSGRVHECAGEALNVRAQRELVAHPRTEQMEGAPR